MSTVSQRSFTGGEIAPALQARVDFSKYQTSLKTCKNFIPQRQGGATNRPGTSFISEVKDSTKDVRLIPFDAGAGAAYIIEVGDLYMRFHKDGSQVFNTAQALTNITAANPCVVTYAGADTLVAGDEVYISEIVGPIGDYLNGRSFKVGTVNNGANTFILQYMSGSNVDSTTFGAYTSGGQFEEPYEITTTYTEADLFDLQFAQSVDVLTIVHHSYIPKELTRTSDTSWSLSDIDFIPTIGRPLYVSGIGSAGAVQTGYMVTAISYETKEESLPWTVGSAINITAITNANPVVVTAIAHGLQGDRRRVYLSGILGMTELNGRTFIANKITNDTFFLVAEDGTGHGTYTSGGTVQPVSAMVTALAPSVANPIQLIWGTVSGADEYNIYKEYNGVFGLIGVASGTVFNDIGIDPDTNVTPPGSRNPFSSVGGYPSSVSYHEQRIIYANTNDDPETVFTSKTGFYKNFTRSSPSQDDDAVTFKAAGKKFNPVRHILDLSKLVIMTESSEIVVNPDGSALTPSNVVLKTQSYNGSSKVSPITINESGLYIQSRGNVIRDLAFDFNIDGFSGNDVSIFANHLFEGYTIVDWCFQQTPNSNVWAVRSDGFLLCLTYLKEQQVLAWSQHEFDAGLVESCASIPGDGQDDVYLLVKRTIDGRSVKYVEKLSTRFVNQRKAIAVKTVSPSPSFTVVNETRYYDATSECTILDSFLSYDGRNTDTAKLVTLSTGAGWTTEDTLTLTSNTGGTFVSSDVGNYYFLYTSDGDAIRCLITAYSSGTSVSVVPVKNIPTELQGYSTSHYAKAVDTLKGLWHLEGQDVSVFGDAFVDASPYNPAYEILTVTNGTITLASARALIHVGLPITSDLETLAIDTLQSETLVDKKIIIQEVNMRVEKTRGLFTGQKQPADDADSLIDGLVEFKSRSTEGYDSPSSLKTEAISAVIAGSYNTDGHVFVRQIDPLPANILSIHPSGMIPFKGG